MIISHNLENVFAVFDRIVVLLAAFVVDAVARSKRQTAGHV